MTGPADHNRDTNFVLRHTRGPGFERSKFLEHMEDLLGLISGSSPSGERLLGAPEADDLSDIDIQLAIADEHSASSMPATRFVGHSGDAADQEAPRKRPKAARSTVLYEGSAAPSRWMDLGLSTGRCRSADRALRSLGVCRGASSVG